MKKLYFYWLFLISCLIMNVYPLILLNDKSFMWYMNLIIICYILFLIGNEYKSLLFTIKHLLTFIGKRYRISWILKLKDKIKVW